MNFLRSELTDLMLVKDCSDPLHFQSLLLPAILDGVDGDVDPGHGQEVPRPVVPGQIVLHFEVLGPVAVAGLDIVVLGPGVDEEGGNGGHDAQVVGPDLQPASQRESERACKWVYVVVVVVIEGGEGGSGAGGKEDGDRNNNILKI